MSVEAPLPDDHPLKIAWEEYKQSKSYANTRQWALQEDHVDGSLWAAFSFGWYCRMKREENLRFSKP